MLDLDFNESCICFSGYQWEENGCQDIDECDSGTHDCGSGHCYNLEGTYRCDSVIDVVWAVDGTGSYKDNIPTAQANFLEQVDYFKSKADEGNGFNCHFIFESFNAICM